MSAIQLALIVLHAILFVPRPQGQAATPVSISSAFVITLKRQCPLRPSEIENMWHMMKNQNSPFSPRDTVW